MHENDTGNDYMNEHHDSFSDFHNEISRLMQAAENLHRDSFDGKEVNISGFPDEYRLLNHGQGDNPFGFQGTCGLVSCEDVLKQYGLTVTETDMVAHAITNDLCEVSNDPAQSGGTSAFSQAEILKDYGVDANVATMPDLEALADVIESGRSAVVEVNAGLLWDYRPAYGSGDSNHAIVVTGCMRDTDTGALKGFYINDSGRGDTVNDSKRFIPGELMEKCFIERGGIAVITMDKHPLPILIKQ